MKCSTNYIYIDFGRLDAGQISKTVHSLETHTKDSVRNSPFSLKSWILSSELCFNIKTGAFQSKIRQKVMLLLFLLYCTLLYAILKGKQAKHYIKKGSKF